MIILCDGFACTAHFRDRQPVDIFTPNLAEAAKARAELLAMTNVVVVEIHWNGHTIETIAP